MAVRIRLASLLAIAGATALALLPLAALFVFFGVYNVAATSAHSRLIYWLVHTTAIRSIKWRARNIEVPDLARPAMALRGLALFKEHCVLCHGAPGVARQDFAKGFLPGAPPLAQVGREWPPQEVYWTIRHGIKMTAMPAWEYRLADSDLWALTAFVRVLPNLSPADYQALAASQPEPQKPAAGRSAEPAHGPADVSRGKTAFHQYACHMCHQAPGISGPQAQVGTPLQGVAQRRYIAGVLENTPENMLLWIQHPQQIKPRSAMPDLGVTARDARDISAFLYTLK